jgi:hypothetical protein
MRMHSIVRFVIRRYQLQLPESNSASRRLKPVHLEDAGQVRNVGKQQHQK